MSKMDQDTFTYIKDAIEECDDLMTVRSLNKICYEKAGSLEKFVKVLLRLEILALLKARVI